MMISQVSVRLFIVSIVAGGCQHSGKPCMHITASPETRKQSRGHKTSKLGTEVRKECKMLVCAL